LQKLKNKKKHSVENAFTACAAGISLLKTVTDAARIAGQMSTVLLSTARSSFDELQNARKCGQKLYITVESISWGHRRSHPNISGETIAHLNCKKINFAKSNFSFRGFLREKHETNNSITQSSLEKGREPRQTNE
jgi:hypothetical protein